MQRMGVILLFDMSCSKVVDFKLVQVIDIYAQYVMTTLIFFHFHWQSNEVGGSYYMEKEGLQRVLNFLQKKDLEIEALVTDRHRQINKWLRENYPDIQHYYDVWHVAKGKGNV